MKKIFKRVIFVLLAIALYLGVVTIMPTSMKLIKPEDNDNDILQLATSDDIEYWDIDVNQIKQVEIHSGNVDVVLTQEEGNRIVHAINAIQKKDIYSLIDEPVYGPIGISIKISLNNGDSIIANPTQDYRLEYKGKQYYTRYHLDIYEEVRSLQTKYNFQWTNNSFEQEMENFNRLFLFGMQKDIVVNPNIMIINACTSNQFVHILKTLPFYGFKTFDDILKSHKEEIELNDTIETNGYIIKIIEIVDGEITAISVSNK